MFSARVVEAVDVFEEGDFDLAPCLPVPAPDQFCLQRLEEAFDGRIVIAIDVKDLVSPKPAAGICLSVQAESPTDGSLDVITQALESNFKIMKIQ